MLRGRDLSMGITLSHEPRHWISWLADLSLYQKLNRTTCTESKIYSTVQRRLDLPVGFLFIVEACMEKKLVGKCYMVGAQQTLLQTASAFRCRAMIDTRREVEVALEQPDIGCETWYKNGRVNRGIATALMCRVRRVVSLLSCKQKRECLQADVEDKPVAVLKKFNVKW